MTSVQETYRALDSLLIEECAIYKRYTELLTEERGFITAFSTSRINEISSERAALYEKMRLTQEQRLSIIEECGGNPRARLCSFIEEYFPPQLAKNLLKKAETLKVLVAQSQKNSSEYNLVVGYALKIAGGLASIFWSATTSVFRSYSPQGRMKESYHSARPHDSSFLRRV